MLGYHNLQSPGEREHRCRLQEDGCSVTAMRRSSLAEPRLASDLMGSCHPSNARVLPRSKLTDSRYNRVELGEDFSPHGLINISVALRTVAADCKSRLGIRGILVRTRSTGGIDYSYTISVVVDIQRYRQSPFTHTSQP